MATCSGKDTRDRLPNLPPNRRDLLRVGASPPGAELGACGRLLAGWLGSP